MKFDLRRIRRSHGFKCHHRNTDFVLNHNANYVVEECNECKQIIRRLGWDDLSKESRDNMLKAIAEKREAENG